MSNQSFFNFLDYVYITIMLISSVSGFVKGFTRSFLSLCAWIGSAFLSVMAAPYLYPFIEKHFKDPSIVQGVSIGIAYILILIALLLSGHLISDSVKSSVLSGLDRSMGLLFGFLRGIFVPFCVCIIFLIFDIAKDRFEAVNESKISYLSFTASESVVMPYLDKRGTVQKIRAKKELINKKHQQSIEEASRVSEFMIMQKDNTKTIAPQR